MSKYKEKVVMITGASGALGRALCHRFGKAGAKIVALDINKDALDTLGDELKAEDIPCLCLEGDLTRAEASQLAVGQALSAFGRIDVLINNAGVTHINLFQKTEDWILRKVMDVNFFGSVNSTRAALNSLIENKGQIIAISSVAGFAPLIGRTAYSASKHAMHGFFETLRTELRDEQVDVLMVCPSFIGNGRMESTRTDDPLAIHQYKQVIGETSPPEEVAAQIFNSAEKGRRLLITGRTGKLSYWVWKFFPRFYEKQMLRKMKESVVNV